MHEAVAWKVVDKSKDFTSAKLMTTIVVVIIMIVHPKLLQKIMCNQSPYRNR